MKKNLLRFEPINKGLSRRKLARLFQRQDSSGAGCAKN